MDSNADLTIDREGLTRISEDIPNPFDTTPRLSALPTERMGSKDTELTGTFLTATGIGLSDER